MAQLVLVVDDERYTCELARDNLRLAGYDVDVARDGLETLARLGRDPLPAAVILDIRMPNLDGVETCRRIRADARTKSLPLLFLSASAHLAQTRAIEELGIPHLVKPFRPRDLVAAVRAMIGNP